MNENPDIDLILMDIDLGSGIDGTEAAEEILSGHDLPLVFLSSHTEREVVEKTEGITSYGYIVKASGETVLIASVKMAFRLFEAKQETQRHAARNEAIVRALPDLMFVIDKDGYYKEVHSPDNSLLPISVDEVIGKSIDLVFRKEEADRHRQYFNKCLETGKNQTYDYRLDIEGRKHYFEAEITKFDDKHILAIVHDITNRKEAKQKIDNLNSLLMAIRNVNQVIVQEDNLMSVMQKACQSLLDTRQYLNIDIALLDENKGKIYPMASAGEHELREWCVNENDFSNAPKCVRELLTSKETTIIENPEEYCAQCPLVDEDTLHKTVLVPMLKNEQLVGILTACMIPGHDISTQEIDLLQEVADDLAFAREKVKAENALRESEKVLQEIINKNPLSIQILNKNGYTMQVNPAHTRLFGAIPPPDWNFFTDHQIERQVYRQQLEKLKKGKVVKLPDSTYNVHNLNPELPDNPICISGIAFPLFNARGDIERYVLMHEDITERKQAEEKLRQSEELFRSLYENASIGIYRTTPDGRILMANQSLLNILGYESFDDLSSRNLTQEFYESEYPRDKFIEQIERDGYVKGLESVWKLKDGRKIHVLESARLIRDEQGKPLFYEGTIEDITELKEKTEELDRYFNSSLDMLCIADTDGYFRRLNPEWESTLGYTVAELENKKFLDLVHPDDLQSTIEAIKKLESQEEVLNFENRYVCKDGSYRWIEWRSMPFGKLIYAAARDITDHKKTEQMLQKRLQYEKIVSGVSALTIEAEDLADFLKQSVTHICKSVGLSYCYIFEYDRQSEVLENTVEWHDPQVPAQIDKLQKISVSKVKWWHETLKGGENICFSDIEAVPDENAKEILRAQGILSILVVPLFVGNQYYGYIGLKECKFNRAWPEEDVELLTSVARIISGAIERKQAEEALRESEATIRNKLSAILEPDGDIETLHLADIIDADELQTMMEEFYKITQIGGAILDISGKVLVGVGWSDICTKFHRAHPHTAKKCLESDLALANGVPAGTFKAYRCKNNMWDMVSPIVIGGKHLGNIYIGQFFYEDEHVDYELFKKQARQHGFDEIEYIAALDRVPRLKLETVNSAMAFYAKLAEMISSLSYSKIKLSRDIVQRKRAEKVLHKTKYMVDKSPISIFWISPEGKFTYANETAAEKLGYSFEELMSMHVWDIDPNYPRERRKAQWNMYQKVKELNFESEHRRRDGSTFPVRINSYYLAFDDQEMEIAEVEDITESKQAEAELTKRTELLKNITDNMFDMVALADLKGNFTYVGKSHERLGYPLHELIGRNVMEFVHPDDLSRIQNELQISLRTQEPKRVEYRYRCSDGTYIWLETIGKILTDDSGKPQEMLFSSRDITERKKAESALRKQRENYKAIINAMNDMVYVIDFDGNILDVNKKTIDVMGYSKKELLSMTPFEIDNHLSDEKIKELIRNIPNHGIRVFETIHKTKSGELIPVEISFGMVTYREHKAILGTVRDITERKQTEVELQASEERAHIQREAISKLVMDESVAMAKLPTAFHQITKTLSKAMGVERASIWLLDNDKTELRCHSLFEASKAKLNHGEVLETDKFPNYFKALLSDSRIVTEDAVNDPRTCELEENYLESNDISSMIDAAIQLQGEIIGVVSLEHLGEKRKWLSDEEAFVSTAAAMAAQIITNARRIEAEQKINHQLKDKEVLLKEVHHRIKNNLASVASLLSLQANSVDNEAAESILKDAIGRVKSMRLLYDKLLVTEGYEDMSVKHYLEDLIDLIISTTKDEKDFKLETEIDEFHLDVKKLFPIGVIVNELLTNIIKYAFEGYEDGLVKIELKKADDKIKLVIQDNGRGLPEDFDYEQSEGFGLMLVKILAEQLGGEFSLSNKCGTKAIISFSVDNKNS